MIEIKNLSRSFKAKSVFRNITLKLEESDFVFLSGVNGAGKTTLLKVLTNIIRPSSGEIFWNGTSILKNSKEWRRQISYLPAEDNVFLPSLTGLQNIITFCRYYGQSEAETKTRLKQIQEFIDFSGALEMKFANGSSGMKQKIKIAFAFSRPSNYFFLDEPLRSLDKNTRSQFVGLVKKKCQGKLVLVADHSEQSYAGLITRNYKLADGALTA